MDTHDRRRDGSSQSRPNRNPRPVAYSTGDMQGMHMHRHFLTTEAKKKLWRPCREARALGL
jgi:hypothetical protein